MKIAIFDSGVGGITVLSELKKEYPHADYIYLGDTANVPYGSKSVAQIRLLVSDCARTLKKKHVDAVVVACNSASSVALDVIEKVMGKIPVIGVVEPGVHAILNELAAMGEGVMAPILVLATRATVGSQVYSKTLRRMLEPGLIPGRVPCPILEQACPLLVPMIEEGWLDHPILHETIREYVANYVKYQEPGVALLGCTHYPWIQPAIEKALPGWKVVNSAQAVLSFLKARFGNNLGNRSEAGTTEWIFTDPHAIPVLARPFIQEAERTPAKVGKRDL